MNNTSHICNFLQYNTSEYKPGLGYWINGPLLSMVLTIGLCGNVISFLTFTKPKNRLPQINQYLIALSIWDAVLIVSSFFVYNLPYLMHGHILTYGPYVLIVPLWFMLSCASYMCSIWMVMISAVDRYFALCRPMLHRLYIKGDGSMTKCILLISSLVCLAYNAPRYLEMTVDECLDPRSGARVMILSGDGLRTKELYWIYYKIIGGLLFYSAVPFAALTYLSARVSYEVRRLTSNHSVPVKSALQPPASAAQSPTPSTLLSPSSDHDKRVTFYDTVIEYESKNSVARTSSLRRHSVSRTKKSANDQQQALNFMLVAVLLKFLICHSLPTILDVWESSMGQEYFGGPVIDVLVDASNFLVMINSSVNVFIYVWCSARFRRDMVKVVECFFVWNRCDKLCESSAARAEISNGNVNNYRRNLPKFRITSISTASGSGLSWMNYILR